MTDAASASLPALGICLEVRIPSGSQYATPAEAARLGDFCALSAAAARDIPRATRVVVPDCGHIPHLEHPGQFIAELVPFLAR